MSKTIRFKVYLTRENICGEVVTTEIRRFNMADDKTLTFDKIEGWLKHVFPDVSWVDAKITWKDTEFDNVAISTDHELDVAVTEMKNRSSMCRFYVLECTEKINENLLNEEKIKRPREDE